MALSDKARKRFIAAMARRAEAEEILEMIEAGGNPQAANVAEIADPSTADAEEVANKVNELLGALVDAGLMADA